MKMKHLIIEGFCDEDQNQNTYPCNGNFKFGVHCLECPRFSYTFCPNEIAISDEDGIVEVGIGFGGDMEPDEAEKREEYVTIWNDICKEKMNEAYDEFMKSVHKVNDM